MITMNDQVVKEDVVLYIYHMRVPELVRFENITIYQQVRSFTQILTDNYYASGTGVNDRLCSRKHWDVYYQAQQRDILIWTLKDADNQDLIKDTISDFLTRLATKKMNKGIAELNRAKNEYRSAMENIGFYVNVDVIGSEELEEYVNLFMFGE